MKSQRMRRTRILNTLANIALIAAGAAVVIDSAVDIRSRLRQPQIRSAPPAAVAYRPGTKAPVVSGVEYARSDRTLLLFLSTKCTYCKMSAPFYRDLETKLEAGNAKHRLIAVFPQARSEVMEFKSLEKLDIEAVADAQLGELGISSTPTLVLVSREGIVIRTWVGAPGKETQTAIAAAFISG